MRIALTICALQLGGMETCLKGIGDYFIRCGHEVDFVETHSKGRWSDSFQAEGYNVKTIAATGMRSKVMQAKRIAKVLDNYDVILLNDAPFAQSILGLLRKEIVIIPILHLDIRSFIKNVIGNTNQWDRIVTVSPGLTNIITTYFNIPNDRVVTIPNSVEVTASWPKNLHNFSAPDATRVTYIGRLEHVQKGIFHLPGIFARVRDAETRVILDIVGDGPDLGRLKNMFSGGRGLPRVVFHGGMEHRKTLELLSLSDVLILPSHFEGLPMVVLEAMARGVVPVVSDLSGFTDCVVEHGVNGFLAEPCDEEGFAGFLNHLSQNRNRLEMMSRLAWKTILERFSIERTGEMYLKLIADAQEAKEKDANIVRSGDVEMALLGDLPHVPCIAVRPIRKFLRVFGLWPNRVGTTQELLEGKLTSLRSCKFGAKGHYERL